MARRSLLALVALLAVACGNGGTPVAVPSAAPASDSPEPSPAQSTFDGLYPLPSYVGLPTASAVVVPGRYVFPVQPPSATHYAHVHHDYPATDILAPCGTEVVAATSGRIDEVSRVDTWRSPPDDGATRGGLFVSLVGNDGVRYYGSHLSQVQSGIEAGVRVSAGQRLGAVGQSGDARGTACHLHFGISPPRGPGDWQVRRGVLYPWPYLDSWKAGGQKSPKAAVAEWAAAHPA